MYVTIDRRTCEKDLADCERCLGIFITTPEGAQRACITDLRDDGSDMMTLHIISEEGEDTLTLARADAPTVAEQGWSRFVHFKPANRRH